MPHITINIDGATTLDVMEILESLGKGVLHWRDLQDQKVPPAAPSLVQPQGPAPEQVFVEPRMVEAAPGVAQIMPAKPAINPVVTDAKTGEQLSPKPAPKVEEPAPAATPDAPKSAATIDVAVAKGKKRAKDVITYLIACGLTDVDALVAKAQEMKGEVPVLLRLPDLEAEVRRVAAIQLA